jgi:hypothetical protein
MSAFKSLPRQTSLQVLVVIHASVLQTVIYLVHSLHLTARYTSPVLSSHTPLTFFAAMHANAVADISAKIGGRQSLERLGQHRLSPLTMSPPPESPIRILITVKQRHPQIWQEAWEQPEKMISSVLKYLKYDNLVSPDDKCLCPLFRS